MEEQTPQIELRYLSLSDFSELKEVFLEIYGDVPDAYWKKEELQGLLKTFPKGQVVVLVNGKLAGCAFSIVVDSKSLDKKHTYEDIVGDAKFKNHSPKGDTLYGIDIIIKKEFRGLRLGRRLYDYRKELCEQLNLKAIVFGGRLPNYHKYSQELSAKAYIEKVRQREIADPVLNFQLANDFRPVRILSNYLEGDAASKEYAVWMQWDNIYYTKDNKNPIAEKTEVRLGLVQWQMRSYKSLEELMHQVAFFVESFSGYRSDFALFPEFFNAPLMAQYNHLSEAEAIRKLAGFTQAIREKMMQLAVSYNINIISGSMPEIIDDKLYNVGYLCRRDGSVEQFKKIHVTPDEAQVWGLQGGDVFSTFDTDCGKIGILICYDVEFPELSRIMALEGMQILFVPFLTDTQNGFSRVKLCAQARAVENECYVAIAGSVGNLPKVHNMDIQYAQSAVFTPSDFKFPYDGIKAETTPNTEMILIADVDLDALRDLHNFGSVKNLKDRREDLYSLKRNFRE
ncbi:carbon-nitrogen hydrolase family protein [Haloflavibacter putidus]|uniref:GNAT family N-acetyltransferase n=1 Tax=Haloflavibacter putidus TaxID=2576776 RepID=A0A507Z8J7_9FLAO|nr:carbon-nitrogen hydrolase family protein [Haloflavibacter putidus]TQD33369.1 GNAT family N-acetyltransferase [Haloflavibacter putidus]